MMTGHAIDCNLESWEDVGQAHDWSVLFAGNGLSMNIWDRFGYSSLFEQARKLGRKGGLTRKDLKLFEASDTENFEVVLSDLLTTIRLVEALGRNSEPFRRCYENIRNSLGNAVRAVHIDRVEAPERSLQAIRKEMRTYDRVFTTSYDLITYWSMGWGESFDGFCDSFLHGAFDPRLAALYESSTSVYFLHGALHLVVSGDGKPKKLSRTERTLLEQFGEPIAGDLDSRPLLISEGSHFDKLRAIDANPYLAHSLKTFRESDQPLVVFGHGLEDQDQHLVDAINSNPARPVAVSCRPASKGSGRVRIRKFKSKIRGRLLTEELLFFDSTSHPLGASNLTKTRRAPWR